ncbi:MULTISPECIES: hypothetical protein [unclassified Acinetobacter]|uniref:hypothetical protein n=1 Tax=unclassified Acinetobacter TaxID=196816 RepID=UPI00293527B2|nr:MULTISPECIES: hypothetical protein [unclassified Acinetobacter]WOE32159.1 hypothetical protein QSG84_02795 [Acinetobacter sp. SAAs470]WOE37629.1 hypothetical protein QSG86_11840 [Acinetobacter sp. SAAs474]
MAFQTQVHINMRSGKQNMHMAGYFADNVAHNAYIESSRITNGDGAIDKDEVIRILLAKHPVGTEILLLSISNLGLQES